MVTLFVFRTGFPPHRAFCVCSAAAAPPPVTAEARGCHSDSNGDVFDDMHSTLGLTGPEPKLALPTLHAPTVLPMPPASRSSPGVARKSCASSPASKVYSGSVKLASKAGLRLMRQQ